MRETIQNNSNKQFHAVSLSGGKDSTAMVLLMIEGGLPTDMVPSADTGMEFPEMYAHLAKVDEHLYRERGLHITTLRHPYGFEWMMFERPVNRSPDRAQNGYGWPLAAPGRRWCTGHLKTHLINKEVNRLKRERNSFFPSAAPAVDGLTDGFDKRAEIKEQIEYDCICQQHDRMQLDELVEIMLEVAMNRSPTIKIGRDAEYPTGFVQQRFEKITSMHIEKVMDGIRENTTRVWNTKAYLMAALFNSVSTIDNHYTMLVNHDFHSGL